ncbi:MAG: START domain-containing protein, partial [Pseudomonadota bacterium]
VEAPMAVLAEVLKDLENYPAWMSKCEKATVIQDLGGGSFLIHYVQSMPWPVTNRDVVLLADTRFLPESGRMEVTLAAAPDSAPPDKDFVRMTSFAGHMELTWLSRNQTRVRFTMRADPAGSLPAKAVNAGALDVPYKTLLGMREMAGKEKYIQAGAVSPVRGLFEAAARKGAAR